MVRLLMDQLHASAPNIRNLGEFLDVSLINAGAAAMRLQKTLRSHQRHPSLTFLNRGRLQGDSSWLPTSFQPMRITPAGASITPLSCVPTVIKQCHRHWHLLALETMSSPLRPASPARKEEAIEFVADGWSNYAALKRHSDLAAEPL